MIRAATPADADAIIAFWNPVIRETAVTFNSEERSADGLAALITQKAHDGFGFFVAEIEGAILGFASYGQFRAGSGYRHSMEHTIILAPAARGRGAGRALMQAIEAHAAAQGHHVMVAAVSGSNPAGIAFHAAIGYAEVGRMPQQGWKFGRHHDLVLMQKLLS